MSKVIVKDNIQKFARGSAKVFDNAMKSMARDVKLLAKIYVPRKEGNLQDDIKDERKGQLKYRVLVDSNYGGYQERGMRVDGSHVVKKYTTPNTGKAYLERAGTEITNNGLNYLKQAVNGFKL